MPSYPAYGELLLDGYSETPASAVDRTDMDDGLAKQGQVRSRALVARPVTYRYSSAQFITWKTWFRDTIARGASWFDWDDPLTDATKSARIQRGDYTARANAPGDGPLTWDVSFTLETWDD